MKKYKEYMDGITVSDTLHEKLKHLKPAKKRPVWQKYGALAAALVLVLGLGAWGLTRDTGEIGLYPAEGAGEPEINRTENSEPDMNPVPVPMPNSPGMGMMGGYEVRYGDGENSTVAYYYLPAIRYGEVENEMAADIALPVGVTRRDLTDDELLALLGGETNLVSHLNWGGYTVAAHAMVWPDESLWLLYIGGWKGDSGYEHFELEVMPGSLPPTCLVYQESVINNIWEREVAAERYDGEHASTRRVSFMNRDFGYRFEITGSDTGAIDELVSRAVRWIIVGDGLTFEKEEPTVNSEEMTTMPYDPVATPTPTAEPQPN